MPVTCENAPGRPNCSCEGLVVNDQAVEMKYLQVHEEMKRRRRKGEVEVEARPVRRDRYRR